MPFKTFQSNPLLKKIKKILKIWRSYNLSIILGIMFFSTWTAQFLVQKQLVKNEAQEKGLAFEWHQFWPKFWTATLENWQSEFLQLFSFVVLTSFLIHKGSPESRDSEDRSEKKLDKIIELLSAKK